MSSYHPKESCPGLAVSDLDRCSELFLMILEGSDWAQVFALRTLVSTQLGHLGQVWFLARRAVSSLIDYSSRSAIAPSSRELALRLLVVLTFELRRNDLQYPADIENSHFKKLAVILTKYPTSAYHVLWTLYELTKFEQGRRAVVDAGIHKILAKIVVSQLNPKLIAAALYLLCDLAGDESCSEALIQMDVFRMFRMALHRHLVANFEQLDVHRVSRNSRDFKFVDDFVRYSEHQRMNIHDADVIAAYFRLSKALPIEWTEVQGPWCELILTHVQHSAVVKRATQLEQHIFGCLQLILLLASDDSVIRLIEIVSSLVQMHCEEALNWIFKRGFVETILARYPWRQFSKRSPIVRQLMEETVMLIVHVVEAIPPAMYTLECADELTAHFELNIILQMPWTKQLTDKLVTICRYMKRIASGSYIAE